MNVVGLKKGIVINFVAKYSNIIIQLVINSILARLLTPKEFGVVAIVMVFITFFNLLGDMGIGPAIIQNKDLSDDEVSDIFLFTFFAGIFLSLVFYIFSYFITYIYSDKVYIPIGHLLSLSILFNVLNIVPNSVLLKSKEFKIIGLNSIIVNLICGLIAIVAAFKGLSYYSLVLNSIIQSFMLFVANLYFSRIRINLRFNYWTIKKISNYSIYQFLFNFINYFSRNLDNLAIGKFLGLNPLAFYDKAYKLMLYPVQNLTFVITPVLHPILSEHQNDKEIILAYYKKIVKILALLGVFVSICCYFSAKEIILIMYGPQWINSITAFKILSITICLQIVASSSGVIFQSTGQVQKLFLSGLLSAIVTIISIVVGVMLGKIEFVAMGILISFTINFFQAFYILIKLVFHKSYIEFLKEFKGVIVIAIIMVVAYKVTSINISNVIISIIYKGIVGTVSFIFGLFLTKEYKTIKLLAKRN